MKQIEELSRPTTQLVSEYVTRFKSAPNTGHAEIALQKLFETVPLNVELSDVYLKVAALNSIYATNIYAVFLVAQHIHGLKIDERLRERDLTLVYDIATVKIRDKYRHNYSFASKYCAWHYPNTYPIYDSYVHWLLWRYQLETRFFQPGFKRDALRDYRTFVDTIHAFQSYFDLQDMSIKEIDSFLWLYAQDTWNSSTKTG